MLKKIIKKINNLPVDKLFTDGQFDMIWDGVLDQKITTQEVNYKKTEIVMKENNNLTSSELLQKVLKNKNKKLI